MPLQDTDILLVNRNGTSFRETFENLKDEVNDQWDRTGTTLSPANAGDTVQADAVEAGQLTAANLTYPAADGTPGQVLTTDGAGGLTFEDAAGGGANRLNDLEDVTVDGIPTRDGQALIWDETSQQWLRSTDSVLVDELPSGLTVSITDPGGGNRFEGKTFGVELEVANPGFPVPTAGIRVSASGNIVFQARSNAPTNLAGTTRNSQLGDFCDQGGYYFGIYNSRHMIVAPVLQDPNNWNTSTTLQGGYGRTPGMGGAFGRYPQNCNWHSQKGGGTDSGNYNSGFNATFGNGTNQDMQIFWWCRSDPNGPNGGAMNSSQGGDGTGTGINGFNDWYIGARNEVVYLYRQLKPSTEQNRVDDNDANVALPLADPSLPQWTANDPTMTTAVLFQGTARPDQLGNETHTNAAHWSTTQRDAEKARRISFGSGWDDNRDNKDQGCTGRAIRSTTTQPITSVQVFTFNDAADIADFTVNMQVTQENTDARGQITDITDNTMEVVVMNGTFNDTDILLGPADTFTNPFFFTLTDDGDDNMVLSDPTQADPGFVTWNATGTRFLRNGTIEFPLQFDGTDVDNMLQAGTALLVEIRLTNTVGSVDESGTTTPTRIGSVTTTDTASLKRELDILKAFIIKIENERRVPGTEAIWRDSVYTWTGEYWVALGDTDSQPERFDIPLEDL